MKKLFSILLMFALVFSCIGCTAQTPAAEQLTVETPAASAAAESPSEAPTGAPAAADGELKPFKIGLMIGLTGPNAALGLDGRHAVELYLDQVDYVIGDYKIELIVEDDQVDPEVTLTKAKKLVEMDKVDLLLGPHGAAGAYALLDYINAQKIALYIPGASGDDVTMRKRSEYAVRTGTTSSQPMHPLGDYVAKELGYKKGAIISYDHSYGYEVAGGFQAAFEACGGDIVYKVFVPNGTTDFSPYISNIPVNDIDFLFFNASGADSIRLTAQLSDYGISDKLPIIAGCTPCDEATLQDLDPSCEGFISALAYAATLDTEANKSFVSAFENAYGSTPGFVAEQYYTGMMFLAAALENCEDPYDPLTLINTIKSTKVDNAPRGPIAIDEYGNVVHNVYIRKVEVVDGVRQNTVIKTYEDVSQFWTWSPEEFLAHENYSATYPPVD